MSSDPRPGSAPDHEQEIETIRREARRMAWLFAAAGVFLLPWIVFLAVSLPGRDLDRHYNLAWVGFDLLLAFAVFRTAWFAFRLDPRVQIPATATATLLIVDAWFDVTTSGGRNQFLEAALLAACVEIPAAIFSIYLVRHINRHVSNLADFEHLIRTRDHRPPAEVSGNGSGSGSATDEALHPPPGQSGVGSTPPTG